MRGSLVVLVALVVAGIAFATYNTWFSFDAALAQTRVQQQLNAVNEFVFSREPMTFTDTTHDEMLLAHIDYRYSWEALVPFGFTVQDLDLTVDKSSRTLTVLVKRSRLLPFEVRNRQAEIVSAFAWLNQGNPAETFWASIEDRTRVKVNQTFLEEPELAREVGSLARETVRQTLQGILDELQLNEVSLEVKLGQLELYDGQTVTLEASKSE